MKKTLLNVIAAGAAMLAGCTTAQLQKAQRDIEIVGDTIDADAPTIIAALQQAGALSDKNAAKTIKALQTFQQFETQTQGLSISKPADIVTGVQAVDTAIQQYVKPGTSTASDLAVANNLLTLANRVLAANASPSPSPSGK